MFQINGKAFIHNEKRHLVTYLQFFGRKIKLSADKDLPNHKETSNPKQC